MLTRWMIASAFRRRMVPLALFAVAAAGAVSLTGDSIRAVFGAIALGGTAALLGKAAVELAAGHEAAHTRIGSVARRVDRQTAALKRLKTARQRSNKRLGSIDEALSERVHVDDLLTGRLRLVEASAGAQARLIERVRELESGLATTTRTSREDRETDLLARRALQRRMDDEVSLMLGTRFQQLDRVLTDADVEELLAWLPILELDDIPRDALYYLGRRLIVTEATSSGRLAASTADGVFRALVASAALDAATNVLEIGVLFGINACFLWSSIGADCESFHLTLLDPFEGYYGQDRDPYTGARITVERATGNLGIAQVPVAKYRLLVGFSTEAEIVGQASDRTYGLVFIDGDHSYEGVKFDFETYAGLVAPGGYVMIDDYGAPAWPGVTKFVDELTIAATEFEYVGTFRRTAVLRRPSSPTQSA